MTRTGLLLRWLLVLSLVLNGVGSAMAATAMASAASRQAQDHDAPVAAHAAHAGVAAMDHAACHHHAAAPARAHGAGDAKHAVPARMSDCCGVGQCGCACAQLASIAWTPRLPGTDLPALPAPESPMPPAHAAPALPHLIRPPIG